MAREPDGFMEIYQLLLERFGKPNINAKEYAQYLGKTSEKVRNSIRMHELPGAVIRGKGKDDFVISVASIARFELKMSNV